MTAPGRMKFSTARALLWINFAELAGKNTSGQCSQLALTSTNTLLFGTTIWSCLVGMGGFLYWRRAFWICCLTANRAASNVGVCTSIFGKSGTWAVQPSGDKVQSTGYPEQTVHLRAFVVTLYYRRFRRERQ